MLAPEFETLSPKPAIVEKAIKMSLLARGWTIVSLKPGRIEAQYRRADEFSANIAVVYSGSHVAIKYVDSKNLLTATDEHGQTVIHRNYNNWVTYLEHDIQANVAALM